MLCPFDTDREHLRPILGHEYAWIDPQHTQWLAELGELYDLAWASMWERGGNDVIAPVHDLPPLPFVVFSADGGLDWNDQTPKLKAVKEFVDDRPTAWIDDDFFPDAFVWASDRTRSGIPTQLVHTNPRCGLAEHGMSTLRLFAKMVAESDTKGLPPCSTPPSKSSRSKSQRPKKVTG